MIEKYYCYKCKKHHRITSDIGKKHLKIINWSRSGKTWREGQVMCRTTREGFETSAFIHETNFGHFVEYTVNYKIRANNRWLDYSSRHWREEEPESDKKILVKVKRLAPK